jgi:hypothetical protein
MKTTKLIHIVIVGILVLISIAIFQWTKLPRNATATSGSAPVTAQPAELPTLPQNELYKLHTPSTLAEKLPPFTESPGDNNLEPKDKTRSGKPML